MHSVLSSSLCLFLSFLSSPSLSPSFPLPPFLSPPSLLPPLLHSLPFTPILPTPQIYVDQVTEEIVAVTRHSPSTHQSVILMAHTAFRSPDNSAIPTDERPDTHYTHVPPLTVPGQVQEIILEARLMKRVGGAEFQRASDVINGLEDHMVDMRRHVSLSESNMCHLSGDGGGSTQEVVFNDFSPGSIIIFK